MSGDGSIKLSAVTFRYPDGHLALDAVDLTIGHGERVAVLGPNGAGKTTLALHLNGIHAPASGSVAIGGVTVDRRRHTLAEVRRKVGIVFQDPDDQLFMPTVRGDVAFGPANFGVTGADLSTRVETALTRVGMSAHAHRPPHHLSYGERRRVAVATVLATEPDVLVLDEPTANLDPSARRELATILDSLDLTIVLVTHDLPYALQLCERSVLLNAGRIVADGDTAAILSDERLLAANRLELPFGFSGFGPGRTGNNPAHGHLLGAHTHRPRSGSSS
jgi:cobalt/nickel transport system ATP-binding protein